MESGKVGKQISKAEAARGRREADRPAARRRALFEALEQRFLLAAQVVVPPHHAHHLPAVSAPLTHDTPAPHQHPILGLHADAAAPNVGVRTQAAGVTVNLDRFVQFQQSQPAPSQLIIVDGSIPNAAGLVQGLLDSLSGTTSSSSSPLALRTPTGPNAQLQVIRQSNVEIVVIDSRFDGIQQLSTILGAEKGLDAVQVIAHGAAGELRLGTTILNSSDLSQYAAQVKGWGQALRPGGDLLLYGCDVANGSLGVSFVNNLAALTGVTVAAATHDVGSAALGGDWVLDYKTGALDVNTLAVSSWNGLLNTLTGAVGGGSTLQGSNGNTLTGFASNNTYLFTNGSGSETVVQAATGTNNTLDFSAVTTNVTVTVGASSITVTYGTNGANTITIATASAGMFNLVGSTTATTTIDYTNFGSAVAVDLTRATPSTFFGSINKVQAAIGASVGGNTFKVNGSQSVTAYSNDVINASGGGNQLSGVDGSGNITLNESVSVSSTLAGDSANATLTIGTAANAPVETLTNVGNVVITDTSSGGKTLDGTGFAANLSLVAANGGDTLKGGSGNNQFTGTKGTNSIVTQAAAINQLVETGDWNFTLTNTALTTTAAGATPLVTDNITGTGLTDAFLTGGNSNETIDASAFTGNTILAGGTGTTAYKTGQGGANTVVSKGGAGSIVAGANSTNTIDLSAVTVDSVVTVHSGSLSIASGSATLSVASASAGAFSVIGSAVDSVNTTLDYSGYGSHISADLTGASATATATAVTFFAAVQNITAVIGASVGGNTFTIDGNESVTMYANDTANGSGGGNTYVITNNATEVMVTLPLLLPALPTAVMMEPPSMTTCWPVMVMLPALPVVVFRLETTPPCRLSPICTLPPTRVTSLKAPVLKVLLICT